MEAQRYGKIKKYRTTARSPGAKRTASRRKRRRARSKRRRPRGFAPKPAAELFARGAPRRLFQHRRSLSPGRRHATPRREPPLAGQWPQPSWPPLSLFSRFASLADSAARLTAFAPLRPGALGSSQASSISS